MKPEEYRVKRMDLEGFPIRVTSYRIEGLYHVTIDNVDPGARIARAEGSDLLVAEAAAMSDAQRRLARTRRIPI